MDRMNTSPSLSEGDEKNRELDVVLIATIRPEILALTLGTFKKHLLRHFKVRLIVNVDPSGEPGHSQQEIVALCQQFFSDVIYRTPETPSFSAAVAWGWRQVQTAYFLHLEDDWCLKRLVEIPRLFQSFERSDCVSVRLSLSRNKKYDLLASGELHCGRLSLNPSVFKTSYIRELLVTFNPLLDPEKQFVGRVTTESHPCPLFIVYGSRNDSAIVIDTGKRWRKKVGVQKWDLKAAGPVTWKTAKHSTTQRWDTLKYRISIWIWKMRHLH